MMLKSTGPMIRRMMHWIVAANMKGGNNRSNPIYYV